MYIGITEILFFFAWLYWFRHPLIQLVQRFLRERHE
jgi:hypothetical protein